MDTHIVLITGATSGIGKAAAMQFARNGYTVIMACRNMEQATIVQHQISAASGNERVFAKELDISDSASIREFCKGLTEAYDKLDILIHNAAYFNHGEPYKKSADGYERTFATNVLGPYLMNRLLLDLLKNSGHACILHAGSNIIKHFFDPKKEIDFGMISDEASGKKPFVVYNSYRDSKMALLMLTFQLAQDFEHYGIRVNNLQINGAKMSRATLRKTRYPWRLAAHVQNLFFRPPEFMANLYFTICTSSAFRTVSGKLVNHRLEIMRPGDENPDFSTTLKQLFGAEIYPLYAHNREALDRINAVCQTYAGSGSAL